MLTPYFLSALVSTITAIFVQSFFIRAKKFDRVNHRSSHNSLATRTGGISLFSSLIICSFYFYSHNEQPFDFTLILPVSIMFITGFYDDFYNANFKIKFFVQIIVAKLIIDQGYIISNFYGVFDLYEIPRFYSQLFTVFVFLIIVNSINFIDGIDGLALSIFLKFILVYELIHVNHENGMLLNIMATALIPLFYFNLKKNNKVFLGDAGSLLIGTVISIYIFQLLQNPSILNNAPSNLKPYIAIILLVYPLIDLFRICIIRLINGKSPFEADNNHIHHFLLKRYKSHVFVTFILISFEVLFSITVYFIYKNFF